jgi:hypothetical protein
MIHLNRYSIEELTDIVAARAEPASPTVGPCLSISLPTEWLSPVSRQHPRYSLPSVQWRNHADWMPNAGLVLCREG